MGILDNDQAPTSTYNKKKVNTTHFGNLSYDNGKGGVVVFRDSPIRFVEGDPNHDAIAKALMDDPTGSRAAKFLAGLKIVVRPNTPSTPESIEVDL